MTKPGCETWQKKNPLHLNQSIVYNRHYSLFKHLLLKMLIYSQKSTLTLSCMHFLLSMCNVHYRPLLQYEVKSFSGIHWWWLRAIEGNWGHMCKPFTDIVYIKEKNPKFYFKCWLIHDFYWVFFFFSTMDHFCESSQKRFKLLFLLSLPFHSKQLIGV